LRPKKFDRLTRSRGSGAVSDPPEEAVLERVVSDHPDTEYLARFSYPEFTTICPVTGQPDFGHFVIDTVLHQWLPESKSLKLYLRSVRNHGAFHEDCTKIAPVQSASGTSTRSNRNGCELPDFGARAAASRLKCFGGPARRRMRCGRRTLGCPLIAVAFDRSEIAVHVRKIGGKTITFAYLD